MEKEAPETLLRWLTAQEEAISKQQNELKRQIDKLASDYSEVRCKKKKTADIIKQRKQLDNDWKQLLEEQGQSGHCT